MAADPQAAPSRAPDQSAVVSKTPSRPPPAPVRPLVQAIDHSSDIAGVIGLTVFAISRSMDATLFCVTLCAILGVQTGLRKGLAARGGVGLGAAGLALLGLAHAVHTAAAGGGSPGYLRLPGWYRRGLRAVQHAAVGARALWSLARLRWLFVLVAALALAMALAGCPLPPVDGCRPGATRCSSTGIPQRCSGTGRWWQEPTAQTCSTFGATCCLAASPYGGTVYACVPAVACVPSPAGPTSSPSALAETQ